MESPELRYFVKVVQAGSFTEAANLLGTQKTHISRVISRLEKTLGVRLLERTTRSLSLTEIGREIFERAVSILGEIEDAERVVQKMAIEPMGLLKLTCSVDFGMIAVRKWIAEFMMRYPRVTVEADYSSRIVDLVHEGFDVAIRVGRLPDSSLVARKLGTVRYGLFASPDYLKRYPRITVPQDVGGHDIVQFSGGSYNPSWMLYRNDEAVELDGQVRLKVNNSFSVLEACGHGLGLGKLPLRVAAPAVESGRLLQVLDDWRFDEVDVHAIYPSARYLTPKVRTFIDYAVAHFGE
jgi:LysR family transcriptional regulator for bpeEF and oprC